MAAHESVVLRKKMTGRASKQQHAEEVQRSKEIEAEQRRRDEQRLVYDVEHAKWEASCARKERGDYPSYEGVDFFCFGGQPDDGKEITECDTCHEWFHFECLEADRVLEGEQPRTLAQQRLLYATAPYTCCACKQVLEEKSEMLGWEKEEEGMEGDECAAGEGGEGGSAASGYFVVTARCLLAYVNSDLLEDNEPVSLATCKRWIKKLGFTWARKAMTVFMDGHERFDVIEFRTHF